MVDIMKKKIVYKIMVLSNIFKVFVILLLLILFIFASVWRRRTLEKLVDNYDWVNEIDCYVITLKKIERLRNLEEQQKKTSIIFNLFDAFDGNTLKTSNYKMDLKMQGILDEFGEGFLEDEDKRNREIGCYLSHLNLYKSVRDKMLDPNYRKKYTIVFEDDIILGDNFMDKLGEGLSILENKDFDILYLGNTHLEDWEPPSSNEQIGNGLYKHQNWNMIGCWAMLINNKNMDKIISLIERMDKPIDLRLNELIKNGILNVYYYEPLICGNRVDFTSTIRD